MRDTKSHSIFIDPSGEAAFGVLGLTQRIRDVSGSSGVMVKTGMAPYAGRYVTDGIIARVIRLGPGIRRDCSDALVRLRKEGRFHTAPGP